MTTGIKRYLDYVPIGILGVSAAYLLWTVSTTTIILGWKHYVGLAFLALSASLFFVKHLYGVLCVGFTLLLGLIGMLSFSPAITVYSIGSGSGDSGVTFLRLQPVFLLWVTIYFLLCGRYFVGIASRRYWTEVRTNKR